ncbi:MAG TPA: BON domain-containing protein [Actinomycetota bacterium]|jgi:osmotically-inducible protein OsmY|nr:BON domain-containing protein [Actinomycetota bacterium]
MRTPEPEEYIIARVREALATDPRVSEPGLEVDIRLGTVFVRGEVPSETVRAAISEVAAETSAGVPVRNETAVRNPSDKTTEEDLG